MSLRLAPLLLRSAAPSFPIAPLARRALATAAPNTPPPPPPNHTPQSFTAQLPPAFQEALRTNPILKELISDPECQQAMKQIGEAMFKSGLGQTGKKPSAMDMASMMANTELRTAIMAFTSSMTRLGVSMSELKPIMTDLMANGGLEGQDPSSPSPLASAAKQQVADPVRDALKAKADQLRGVKETVDEKVEGAKDTFEEVKAEVGADVDARKTEKPSEGQGFLGRMLGGVFGKK